jgi:hypothetical protein
LRSLTELLQRLEALETNVLNNGGGNAAPPRPANRTDSPARPSRETAPPIAPTSRSLSEKPAATTLVNKPVTNSSVAPAPFLEEPPDFPDFNAFDELPPDDLSESAFAPAKTARPVKAAAKLSVSAPSPARAKIVGNEVEAILAELNRLNRTLLVMAFEDAQVSYAAGKLSFVFASEDVICKKVRESAAVFRELGEKLFGQPLNLEVRVSGEVTQVVDEAAQARAQQLAQANQNPAVQLLLDKFKGEIMSVRSAPTAANPSNQV